jgi:hypothetical protein
MENEEEEEEEQEEEEEETEAMASFTGAVQGVQPEPSEGAERGGEMAECQKRPAIKANETSFYYHGGMLTAAERFVCVIYIYL